MGDIYYEWITGKKEERMTREEAIEFANEWLKTIDENEKDSLTYEFLTYVISVLQQEPCVDAISRQAVLSMQYRIDDSATLSMRDVVNVDDIEDLPPVTPQPKTGYWHLLDECSNSGFYCSECHKKVVKEGWSETVKKIKFCPNCGARMEVEE